MRSSVADPYHIEMDPEPGAEKNHYGSRSGSRLNFEMNPNPGKNIRIWIRIQAKIIFLYINNAHVPILPLTSINNHLNYLVKKSLFLAGTIFCFCWIQICIMDPDSGSSPAFYTDPVKLYGSESATLVRRRGGTISVDLYLFV